MPSDAYIIAWAAATFVATFLLSNSRVGKYIQRRLRLEIPKSTLPAECCPNCCPRQGELVFEIRTLRQALEKHCRETPARQKEVAEAVSSAIVAALRDVSDSDHTFARELMRESHALQRELRSLQEIRALREDLNNLGEGVGKLLSLAKERESCPRQSSGGANPGDGPNTPDPGVMEHERV